MKEHPQKGYRILKPLTDFKDVSLAVLYHHEKMDGTGYPEGLKGEEIPFLARLVSVVDSFHAMVSKRPYHDGIANAEALAEIKRCSGTQFDPKIVEAFERAYQKDEARRANRKLSSVA